VTAPLFFIVAALAARAGGSELLADMGGVAFRAPVLASLALVVVLATLAMPGSSNFVGEFMILLGVFQAKTAISIIAFAGVVGAAVYALRMFISAFHNRTGPKVATREGSLVDLGVIGSIVLVILVLAFYPQFGLKRSEPSVNVAIAPAHLQAVPTPQRVASR
jgi:NADH-quinone oxidoreductase subunit M